MKFRNPWIDPRVVQVHTADVQAYLADRGWSRQLTTQPHFLHYAKPRLDHGEDGIYVPMEEQAVDFPQRIIEVIADLATIENRFAGEVLSDILRARKHTIAVPHGLPIKEPFPFPLDKELQR